MKSWIVLLGIALVAGCTPGELRRLDYEPSPKSKATWSKSEDGHLRYNGHYELEGARVQTAGDLESRVETLAPPPAGGPALEIVTVAPFGTKACYAELQALAGAARADAVVLGLAVKRGGPRPAEKGPELLALLRDDLTAPRDALVPGDRFVAPAFTPADLRFIEAHRSERVGPDDDELERWRSEIPHYGGDVVLHHLCWSRLTAPVAIPLLVGPGETFERACERVERSDERDPDVRRRAFATAFLAFRVPDLLIETIDALGVAGKKRVVALVPPATAWGLVARARARGYTVTSDRWIKAIPILSDPRRHDR